MVFDLDDTLWECPGVIARAERALFEWLAQNMPRITEAHDPPYRFSPDRLLRGEVYEKPWMPLTLGTVALERGRTDLTIKARSMPGDRMMDVKAVRVRRVE